MHIFMPHLLVLFSRDLVLVLLSALVLALVFKELVVVLVLVFLQLVLITTLMSSNRKQVLMDRQQNMDR